MSSFTLGQAPHRMTVQLSAGTDFVAVLQRSDGQPWPADTQVLLQIDNNTAFEAVVAGSTASFEVPDSTVDFVLNQGPKKAKLYYVNGTVKLLWATGPVVVS